MVKTALDTQLVTTQLKRGFYHLKYVEDQMCGKVLVVNEKNEQLDFAASYTCL